MFNITDVISCNEVLLIAITIICQLQCVSILFLALISKSSSVAVHPYLASSRNNYASELHYTILNSCFNFNLLSPSLQFTGLSFLTIVSGISGIRFLILVLFFSVSARILAASLKLLLAQTIFIRPPSFPYSNFPFFHLYPFFHFARLSAPSLSRLSSSASSLTRAITLLNYFTRY